MAEKYQALYRKWRPLLFEDVVGQDHVSETLKNSIKTGIKIIDLTDRMFKK